MAKQSQRKILVLASLVGVLTLTSALLLALSPPPLDGRSSLDNLWASDGDSRLIDAVFQTKVPSQSDRWKYIYIHQSGGANEPGGVVRDHFVIGNGNGAADGQIQMTQRWNNQLSAMAPAGAASIDPNCISICVVGDFGRMDPTASQTRRLTELVCALQGQLGIGGDNVFMLDAANGSAGVGQRFEAGKLREQFLP
jgi:hypothetical protein